MEYGEGKNYGQVFEEKPVVTIKTGQVQGENRECVAIFRGIPYGKDCGGKRRFLPPEPVDSWEGVRDCTRNGNYAPQWGRSISGDSVLGPYFSGGHPEKFGCDQEVQSEDCLVLNVVTPGIDKEKRPVVIYIHGGGFEAGSGTLVLGADLWAREENLVIVGVNHRLNVFGYLYLGEFEEKYSASGVVGMLDLILFLKWVKENIMFFGGDPENVTIMGESGGAVKVSTLLVMKEARGLFKRAIIESGSLAIGLKTKKEATEQTRGILKVLNIPENHLELLESKTTKEILEAMKKSGNIQAMDFQPVADDKYIPVFQGYAKPEGAEDIPILIGSSEDELAVFQSPKFLDSITWDNIEDRLICRQKIGGKELYTIKSEDIGELIQAYRSLNPYITEPGHLFIKLCSKLSFLASGAYYQALNKAEQRADVFYYVISRDTKHPTNPKKQYSWHTADLPLQMRIVYNHEDEILSQYLGHAWAAFIRTGNPSTGKINWEPFTATNHWAMVIDRQIHMEEDPWKKERELLEKFVQKCKSIERIASK